MNILIRSPHLLCLSLVALTLMFAQQLFAAGSLVFANGFREANRICDRNTDGTFSCRDLEANTNTDRGNVVVGDMNEDGFPDIIFSIETGFNGRICYGDVSNEYTCETLLDIGRFDSKRDIALGDMNNDGHLDIVTARSVTDNNGASNRVCLGDGSRAVSCAAMTGNHPRPRIGAVQSDAVAIADIDKDGNLDVVFASTATQSFFCLGDGISARKENFFCDVIPGGAAEARGIDTGDFDGDDDIDIFIVSQDYQVCLGDGEGGFSCQVVPYGNGPGTENYDSSTDVMLADFNKDGFLDAVVAHGAPGDAPRLGENYNRICLGDGAGNFACDTLSEEDHVSNDVAVGDINDDGHLDAIFASEKQNERNRICYGDGAGNFTCEDVGSDLLRSSAVAVVTLPNRAPVADAGEHQLVALNSVVTLDGSGSSDLDGDTLTYSWSLDVPSGSVASLDDPFSLNPKFTVDVSGTYVATLTVNDGKEDSRQPSTVNIMTDDIKPVGIVFSNGGGETNRICRRELDGSFSCQDLEAFTGTAQGNVVVGDLNEDNFPDIMFSYGAGFDGRICFGDASDSFGCEALPDIGRVDTAREIALGDMNDDGYLDIVSSRHAATGSSSRVCLGDGAGSISCDAMFATNDGPPARIGYTNSDTVALGDFNNDGNLDAVFAGIDNPSFYCLGDGISASFENFYCDRIPGASIPAQGIATGDFEGDGDVDVFIVSQGGAQSIQSCLGDGQSGFTCQFVPWQFPGNGTEVSARDVALGDFNKDGILDAVIATGGDGDTFQIGENYNRICIGDGAGSFSCDFISEENHVSNDVAIADIDHDGHLDAIFASVKQDEVNRVCYGDGDANFLCEDLGIDLFRSSAVAVVNFHENSAPVADAGPDLLVELNKFVTLDGRASFDPDGDMITFNWTLTDPEGNNAPLSDPTIINPTFTASLPGTYVAALVVNDGLINSQVSTMEVSTKNIRPVADAGEDQMILVGDLVTLDGSGSYDIDPGDTLTYKWTFKDLPDFSRSIIEDCTSVNATFTADLPGTYEVRLIVSDGVLFSFEDIVTISTSDVPPIADAGSDQSVDIGEEATLDGSQSSAFDGDPLTYDWNLTTRPQNSNAVLIGKTSVNPRLTPDLPGTYSVSLVVNDGVFDSIFDTVVISTNNVSPVAEAGPSQSVFVGELVNLDGSGSSDLDGDTLSYSWSLPSRPEDSGTTINNADTVTPDFTPDEPGMYVVSLVVNDGTVNSEASSLTVSAATVVDTAVIQIQDLISLINSFDNSLFKKNKHKKKFTNKLNTIIVKLERDKINKAIKKLQKLPKRTDGCANQGSPENNDWIVDCPSQDLVLTAIEDLIGLLQAP